MLTVCAQGGHYLDEGNYAKAYLLLLRHSSLYLGHVTSHSQAKTAEGRRLLRSIKDRIPVVFTELERIKPHLVEAYDEWEKMSAASWEPQRKTLSKYDSYASRDAALS